MTHPSFDKDKFFFLTRDGDIEVTEYDKLFYFGNQCLAGSRVTEQIDEFGRNYTDKLFIRLCLIAHIYLVGKEDTFKSLSCRKDGERYIARLELVGMTLEYELGFMVDLVERLLLSNDI